MMVALADWSEVFLARLMLATVWGGFALAVTCAAARWLPGLPPRMRVFLLRLAQLKFIFTLLPLPVIGLPLPAAAPGTETAPLGTAEVSLSPLHITLLICWLMGAGIQIAMLARVALEARRFLTDARQIRDDEVCTTYRALAQRIGVPSAPALVSHPRLASPMLVGWGSQTIVLPSAVRKGPELWCALAHELAHVRHRDLHWGCLTAGLQVLFFFHPLVWLAARELRHWQEVAADQQAVAALECPPARYAETLLEFVASARRMAGVPVSGLAVASGAARMERRLRALMASKRLVPVPLRVMPVVAIGIFLGPWSFEPARPVPKKVIMSDRWPTVGNAPLRGPFRRAKPLLAKPETAVFGPDGPPAGWKPNTRPRRPQPSQPRGALRRGVRPFPVAAGG